MLGNELVRDLVGTWLVPDRYLVVERYLVGTCTRTARCLIGTVPHHTVRYRTGTVPYGTCIKCGTVPYVRTIPIRYGTLPSYRGLTVFMGGLAISTVPYYGTGTVRYLQ